MYALKKLTVTPDGRNVEECHVLGTWYRLELCKDGDEVARIEHADEKGGHPCISVHKTDEAYITLLTGETVRRVCRGDVKAREQLAHGRHAGGAAPAAI